MFPTQSSSPFSNPFSSPFGSNPFAPAQQDTSFQPGVIPDITQDHRYQALAGLQPSQIGGQPISQQIQQAAQDSQKPGPGGFGGALSGALVGWGLGSFIPGIGNLTGAAIGGLLGAFTPITQVGKNAIVQTLGDIENGQPGSILNDVKNQLFAQAPPPNEAPIIDKVNPFPNVSPFGSTPFLGGLTNPHVLGGIAISSALDPLTYSPISGLTGLAKIASGDLAKMGLQDISKEVTGGVDNVALNKAGGELRNAIADRLGFQDYGSLMNAAKSNPEIAQPFYDAFSQAIKENPQAYLNTVGIKIPVPFTTMGLPIASTKFTNALSSLPPIATLNDNLNTIAGIGKDLFGRSQGFRQTEQQFGTNMTNDIENIIKSNEGDYRYGNSQYINNTLAPIARKFSPEEIKQYVADIETGAPKPDNPLLPALNQFKQYFKDNGLSIGADNAQYFPKELAQQMQGPKNLTEKLLSDWFNITPLGDRNLIHPGYNPAMEASSEMATTNKKFVDAVTGDVKYGQPSTHNLKKAPVPLSDITDMKAPTGEDILGVYKDKKTGDLYYETYLKTEEANKNLAPGLKELTGQPLFQENGLLTLASKDRNARRVVAMDNAVKQLLNIKDVDGLPIVRPATVARNGKFLKTDMDPAYDVLGEGRFKGYYVPKSVKAMIDESFKRVPKDNNAFARLTNPVGNLSRSLMTAMPLFHTTHNVLFNSMLGGESPLKTIGNIIHSAQPGLTEKLINNDPWVQRMGKAGMEIKGLEGELSKGKGVIDNLSKQFPEQGGIATKAKGLLGDFWKYLQNNVTATEIQNKRDMFQNFVKKGMSDEQAANEVEKVLFPYGKKTKFEETYLNNMFSFYNWMKNNTMLWMNHPNEFSILHGIENGINDETAGHQMALNPKGEQNKIYVGRFNGKDLYINPKLPFDEVNSLASDPGSFFAGKLSPLASVPIHLASNTDAFGNQLVNPNLPISLQQKQILPGVNIDPRLAFALQGLLPPLQGLSNPGKTLSPLGLLTTLSGASTSSINPDSQAMQEYMAQKARMDALAQYEQKQGNLTYQQANPYNTSPSTDNYINSLKQQVQNYQDQLYGYHYQNGQRVAGTSQYAQKHAASMARRSGSIMRRRMRSMEQSAARHASFSRAHIRPIDSVIKLPKVKV